MKNRNIFTLLIPFIGQCVYSTAIADDVDVYLSSSSVAAKANVLFVLDESGSMAWGAQDGDTQSDSSSEQRLYQLKQAMTNFFNSPEASQVNAALLGFRGRSASDCENNNSSSCIKPAITVHSDFTDAVTNRSSLLSALQNLQHSGNTPTTSALHDAVAWYKQGYGGYSSPMRYYCQPNHIVLLTDGQPNANSFNGNGWGYSTNEFNNNIACEDTDKTVGSTGSRSDGLCSPDFAEYAFQTDFMTGSGWDGTQNVTTHTIGFHTDTQAETFLEYIAQKGNGGFYTADNASDLQEALGGIAEAATHSIEFTFNAPAIPFDPTNIALSQQYIYLPMLKPETKKFWRGNLKKYKISIDSNENFVLTDANNLAALNSSQLFLSSAQSYWSTSADGADPLAGGAATRNTGAVRNLYTYIPYDGASTTLSNHRLFTFSNNSDPAAGGTANPSITSSMLGLRWSSWWGGSSSNRSELLQWASTGHGFMGAPIHTNPNVISYGATDGTTQEVILMLTSEGVLSAFDTVTGDELWAYMPKELLDNIKTIRNVIENPDDAGYTGSPLYGLDGYLEILHNDTNNNGIINSGESVTAVFGMRRGGRHYYALDLSSRLSPRFMWQIEGGTGSYSELGQTWAKPIPGKMTFNSTTYDVLVISGGYDSDQDDVTGSRQADDLGNAVYIVNAANGQRLWWASSANANLNINGMRNSIAASATPVDVDDDGKFDRIYLADVGGRIIRIDFYTDALGVARSSGFIFADINGGGTAGNRRFFNAPEIGYFSRAGEVYYAVLIGSGNRPHPLDHSVTDRFYMIKDYNPRHPQLSRTALNPTPATLVETSSGCTDGNPDTACQQLYDATSNLVQDGNSAEKTVAQTALRGSSGWYIDLGSAEFTASKALLYNNNVYFTVYSGSAPTNSNACEINSSTGSSRFYALDLSTAKSVYNFDGNNLTATDRSTTLSVPGIPPAPTLFFIGTVNIVSTDDQGNETIVAVPINKIFAGAGLDFPVSSPYKLTPLWWEEALDAQ